MLLEIRRGEMNTVLEAAQYWLGEYLPVLPIRYMDKKASVDWKEFQDRLPTHDEVKRWFARPTMNIGLIVGRGLVVVDFDMMAIFEYWHEWFKAQYPGQSTYMVKTRRGMHVYLHTEEPAQNYHNEMLDIKAERGYVLIPPSVHPSGFEYQVWDPAPILRVQKLGDVLPEWFTPRAEMVGGLEQEDRSVHTEQYSDPWEEANQSSEVKSVDEIRAKISILDLMPDAKPSDQNGRWFVASCPFHEDSNPSFWIDLHSGMCGCRKCNILDMDAINLYARLHNLSNQEAIQELSKR